MARTWAGLAGWLPSCPLLAALVAARALSSVAKTRAAKVIVYLLLRIEQLLATRLLYAFCDTGR